jgi:hypothetical protein
MPAAPAQEVTLTPVVVKATSVVLTAADHNRHIEALDQK